MAAPTFTKDVAPILYKSCVACHRPGEIAPMSLLDYQSARPWAKAIRTAVISRKMPPWFADSSHGEFANDSRLAKGDIETITAWVDAGAPEGNPRDLPSSPKFVEGWQIGKPDVVVDICEDFLVAPGNDVYKDFIVPTNFAEGKWIRAAHLLPGNRKLVHHAHVYIIEPDRSRNAIDVFGGFSQRESGYAKVPQPGTDRTSVGLYLASKAPEKPLKRVDMRNRFFLIPPGAPNHEVKRCYEVEQDKLLLAITPHMHYRGKDATYELVHADGRKEILLAVPSYDFEWQLQYRFKNPVLMEKGSRVVATFHYDNSPNNRANPDPGKAIRWGDRSEDEMMVTWTETIDGSSR